MVDSLVSNKERVQKSRILNILGVEKLDYCLLTLHRLFKVDDHESFVKILEGLKVISEKISIIFPARPRTRKQIDKMNLNKFCIFE